MFYQDKDGSYKFKFPTLQELAEKEFLNVLEKEAGKKMTKEEEELLKIKIQKGLEEHIEDEVRAEIKKQVAIDKNSLLTAFWIFASIVTFISVEVQILKSVCSWLTLAWLSFITLWWLGLFIILIDYIGRDRSEEENNEEDNKKKKNKNKILMIILFFTCCVFIIGALLVWKWDEQQCKENEIHQKFENEYWKKLIELENKIDHNKMFSEMYF